jgi:hypothetical protein
LKQRIGVRIDRLLWRQFLDQSSREKLRPGEALEALVRRSVEAGIAALLSNPGTGNAKMRRLRETFFRVKLTEFKDHVDRIRQNRRGDLYVGDHLDDDLIEQLLEIARDVEDESLLAEFQQLLGSDLGPIKKRR